MLFLYFLLSSALSLLVQVSFYYITDNYSSSLSSKIQACHFDFFYVLVFQFFILKKSYLFNHCHKLLVCNELDGSRKKNKSC